MLEKVKKAYPELDFFYIGKKLIISIDSNWNYLFINESFLTVSTKHVNKRFQTEKDLIKQIENFRIIDNTHKEKSINIYNNILKCRE